MMAEMAAIRRQRRGNWHRRFIRSLLWFTALSLSTTALCELATTNSSRGCYRWSVVSYTNLMAEEHHLTAEMLANVTIVLPVVLRPLRALAEKRLGWQQGLPRARHELAVLEKAMAKLVQGLSAELVDCTIAVVRLRQSPKCSAATQLAKAYRKRGLRHAFIVFGEEGNSCSDCPEFYDLPPLVIRHYFSEDCTRARSKVLTVPMGLQQAPLASLQPTTPASERPWWWSFASRHTNAVRAVIVAWFSRRGDGNATARSKFLLRYPGSIDGYMETLCKSSFALCPRGNHEDTWRLHEALFCGAVPLVTDGGTYFRRYMPERLVRHFVTVSTPVNATSLAAAGKIIDALLADPAALDRRQRRLRRAFLAFQESWRIELADRVAEVAASPRIAPPRSIAAAVEGTRLEL
eukprot:TRINITY_DN48802_c0_g1_i1.p1 TRINITY_DN48802_c0_g1~~TRINITY_DN48802_c0_g1_i1.p1  ORF type:complete len:406 (+),score=56.89 TRINITY_DN48802_c0_g1_i1:117-1334(+)